MIIYILTHGLQPQEAGDKGGWEGCGAIPSTAPTLQGDTLTVPGLSPSNVSQACGGHETTPRP